MSVCRHSQTCEFSAVVQVRLTQIKVHVKRLKLLIEYWQCWKCEGGKEMR